MLRRIILTLLLGVVIPAGARDCIEVVSAGGGYAFWQAVGEGANQAGKELGVDIYFRGPSKEEDSEAQGNIANMIWELHCKALVLAPNAPERARLVDKLNAQGIPTVYIDRDTGGAAVAAVVATNNFKAGQLAGEKMVQALGGRGRVVVLREHASVVSTEERVRGFLEAAKRGGLQVAREAYIGTTVGDTRVEAEKVLATLRGKVDGVFTPNESTTLGTLIQLKKMGLAGKMVHIGFDSNAYLASAVRLGDLHGLVLQRPRVMGYQGVTLAYRAIQGLPLESRNIDTGVVFVTKANVDQPEVARELY